MRGLPRLAIAGGAAFLALLVSHYQLLRLPFYWDELGQFVPAALDIYHRLAWVPYTTVPNVHPPALMAYLALIWHAFGFSILHTRVAMLGLAAVGLVAQWLLARRLSGQVGPASLATILLFCCPLYFSQAQMAQLDMPAMVLTTIALVLFIDGRFVLCTLVCCAAVMTKETAIIAPALFGFHLLRQKRVGEAMLFVAPLVPLCAWLLLLHSATGHWFGSPAFTEYNLFYPLHPVRLALALARRVYYLFLGSGHVIGTIALLIWLLRRRPPLTENWRLAFLFVGVHVVLISVFGGAVLERYLLPALPVLYAAFATALFGLPRRVRNLSALVLTGCLLAACVVNPYYPFPMENNLAWTTFVTLQQQAAEYVEAVMPGASVATTFPMAGALRRPEMGYVKRPVQVVEINDFRESNLTGRVRGHADALILYSVAWDPLGMLAKPWLRDILTRFYGYVPQVESSDVPALTGMYRAFRLCSASQCIDVFRVSARRDQWPGRMPGNAPTARKVNGGAVIQNQGRPT